MTTYHQSVVYSTNFLHAWMQTQVVYFSICYITFIVLYFLFSYFSCSNFLKIAEQRNTNVDEAAIHIWSLGYVATVLMHITVYSMYIFYSRCFH